MSEQSKSIVRRHLAELWNRGNVAVVDELFAATYVNHDPVQPSVKGLEQFKRWAVQLRATYPNLRIAEDDILAEGDKVAIRWTFSGTVSDQFGEESMKGRRVAITGISIVRLADAKIQEMWWSYDQLGANRQLGVI